MTFRSPQTDDAAAIHRLVKQTGVLDVNSLYAYLLVASHFQSTSCVAEEAGQLAGFVSAYRHPEAAETLFVWQVGVDAAWRGRGVASQMLQAILGRPALQDICAIETTISPGNAASKRLFTRLAERLQAPITQREYFTESDFDGASHDAEPLYRIGPISPQTKETL